MTFKKGDRVRTFNTGDEYSNREGVIAEVLVPGREYRVSFGVKGLKDVFFVERELEHLETGVSAGVGFGASVQEVVNEVRDTLIAKNKAYGNSALDPVRVFSTADPVEQLKVRLDDKLSRLKSSLNDDNEDTVLDLMGYLVLLRIATQKQDSE